MIRPRPFAVAVPMKQPDRVLKTLAVLLAPLALAACKHTLEVEGQGDIVEMVNGVRGCALEEFQAGFPRCTDNEVTGDETAVYRALPRPGWRFSHWEGVCEPESEGDDCLHNYEKRFVDAWERKPRENSLPPLRAVFTQDGATLNGLSYVASEFGGEGSFAYATLLDALLTSEGDYRYTGQQFGTRDNFERRPISYQIQSDGQVVVRNSSGNPVSGGAATEAANLVTMVDTDDGTGQDEFSVAFLQAKQEDAKNTQFFGEYLCGHISTWAFGVNAGYARFFRATMDGNGSGLMQIISDAWGTNGTAPMSYSVSSDGTAVMSYFGLSNQVLQVPGSLSADGTVFVGSEMVDSRKGTAICLKSSFDKTPASVIGNYYGAWVQIRSPLLTGVTELGVTNEGAAGELVLRDSYGNGNYILPVNYMLVTFGGELETQYRQGAISPDGQVIFLIETNPNAFPNIALYIRKR